MEDFEVIANSGLDIFWVRAVAVDDIILGLVATVIAIGNGGSRGGPGGLLVMIVFLVIIQ